MKVVTNSTPLIALSKINRLELLREVYRTSVRPKIRVVKGPYEDDPDLLIALQGTLECDVTDIGEHHDDYISDALLAELIVGS